MVAMRNEDQDNAALEGLYDALLRPDAAYLESLQEDAKRSREGIGTGIVLKQRSAKGEISDFDLFIPKYAITVIGARTGGGKTTTMANLAVRLTLKGAVGMYVTLEEPAHALNAKMLACYSAHKAPNYSAQWLSHYDANGIISGMVQSDLRQSFARDVVRNCRVIDANASVDLSKVETPTVLYYPQYIADLIEYRNARASKPLDFVFIDFGQLLESIDGHQSSFERIRSVMQALKNMAGKLGIAVIIGAQMKRECFGLSIWDWEPELIRDGSDLEQAASLIIAVGRDKDHPDPEYDTALRFLKNRNGPKRVAGLFKMSWENCFLPSTCQEPNDGS
jgi:replicative DNA helicase